MSRRGLFITFEGTEGSGKTTQAELLGEWLAKRDPVVVREPGGTELGEQIRDVLLYKGLEIDAEAEMYLFMASRRQLIAEVIVPALAAGQIVIADRYHDSTEAARGAEDVHIRGGQEQGPHGARIHRVSPQGRRGV